MNTHAANIVGAEPVLTKADPAMPALIVAISKCCPLPRSLR